MLTDLYLYQFKRFLNEHIELFPLTLLTGINGMGKSSVVQSLLILRQSFDRGDLQNHGRLIIDDVLANLISPDDMLAADAIDTSVSFTLTDEQENNAKWSIEAKGKTNTLTTLVSEKNGNIYDSSLFASTFQYLNAERIGPRPSYERPTITRHHSPVGYAGEFVANRILETINDEVKLDGVRVGNVTRVYDLISYWVSEIIYTGSKVIIDGSDTSKINLEYTFKDQPNKRFNPVNIGFGFSYALPVIVAILTAEPGSLLIVENPEAHLHPKGQSRMGKLLALAAESGLQIVAETHSDHLLNGIRVAVKHKELNPIKTQIHFFTTGKDLKKLSFAIQKEGTLERWPEGFFDEWDNRLTQLIE
ncbi:AAA family ATPase [Flavobacterium sp. RHBU_24]|uniref:AAA family ATPase n=1 Tax=Flavobacterium sp. RHBU_24 TaxID=3391185 RepID=UPI003984A25B